MKRFFIIALIMYALIIQVSADSMEGVARIEINIPAHTLSLYMDDVLSREYPVCIGKQSTPTPQGEYRVVYKTIYPYWINKEEVVPPGPDNPLGTRWIGITEDLGIHGNNKPDSIGTYASAGCIRMYNKDVQELYELTTVNTPVTIKYDRLKLFSDKYSGKSALVIYPDGYKRDTKGNSGVTHELGQMDISAELKAKAQKAAAKAYGMPVAVSEGIGIFLNNSIITCDAIRDKNDVYINHKAAEDILGLMPEAAANMNIGVKEMEGGIYVNLSQAVKKLGGKLNYDEASGNVYISMRIIKVNGVFAGLNKGDYDKTDLLATDNVKDLGYEFSEDTVDLRIFDKSLVKLKRKNQWNITADSLVEALSGSKSTSSKYRMVDLKLPTFLKFGNEYFRIETAENRPIISRETLYVIYEKAGYSAAAFLDQNAGTSENIDLELFLEDFAYKTNKYRTVIEISNKNSEPIE